MLFIRYKFIKTRNKLISWDWTFSSNADTRKYQYIEIIRPSINAVICSKIGAKFDGVSTTDI